ncbi:diaminopimelate decarboxylase [Catalinimonas alkaloidigena]|uniref:Diaminopimelate decarboxylase n=1 Tax=Catalinimonas alkaloidigena TaxID=1075417 RepID=A0A1G9EWX9_9BACT|nr:diaminopimelate decarboxylase [Catalinimonas alkaloidigena]SDK80697.1 diaminopimelate decarboxylase [Catalinimonas alkaloidigena]
MLEVVDRQYCLQGVPLPEIAREFGTPTYVYDADTIVGQVDNIKKAFGGLKLRIKYAAKALTNLSILRLIRQAGAELDCVSIQEVHLGLRAGFEASEIMYTPNCVAFSEIQEAVKLGVMINIDNLSILEQFGNTYGNSVPCCIRLNPHIMAGGHTKISTGHIDSKFGISILQMRHLLRIVETTHLRVIGLHVHSGSDFLNADVFLKGAELVFEAAENFDQLEFLDFGSGFKVAYKEGDVVTNIDELGQKMSKAFQAFCEEYGRELEIWFEPGKYLVSEAGFLLVHANVVKTTPATVFVGVDSGMNHLIRPMMYDAYHGIFNASNLNSTERIYTVVGNICETDTLGADRKMNEVREGDILALRNAGAYGFSMSSNYNSRFRPAEVLVYQGKAHLIRRRETMEDLLQTQVEIEL